MLQIATEIYGEKDAPYHTRRILEWIDHDPTLKEKYTVKQLLSWDDTILSLGTPLEKRHRLFLEDILPKQTIVDATMESILQCGKCKQHKVDYFEKQTRSADEPMTLFCHCLNCGARWRQ